MKLFYYIRVKFKLILKKFFIVPSFCKECGRNVHDFVVDDNIWHKVSRYIKNGHVLCYDCFCEKCRHAGLPDVWKLVKH
ncbi:MAG: hypothetical protein A4E55_01833 [Pelotomaculum sp. PtaU1.Bin035]|nr:MAG: hypothetical protein A4E55_01833 [Pelotomaculum sp. PtaU1.Bin035]